MQDALERDLARMLPGKADFLLAYNCILRALKAEKDDHHRKLGATFRRFAEHVVRFDTSGKQLGGLHINQTFVALALQGDRQPGEQP